MEHVAEREVKVSVTWRGKTLELTLKAGCTVGELGIKLKVLTNVAPDTMRLLVPRSKLFGSASLVPFSEKHRNLRLAQTGIAEGRAVRMMGVFSAEVEEVSHSEKSEQRIAGFFEEERRAKQLRANRQGTSRKLPQGPYVFCDFRTLKLPGIELNPPAEMALAIMHKLSSDPGIVAIMNKHRWRVGIMTEMAPVGYVGISPKCVLGFNKNHGEEISLRLRTDDLKGFRKYESIKKTLLHELAHMVHSEHDANFIALDKQLNEEAIALDWTKSQSRTLNGFRQTDDTDEFLSLDESHKVYKLGGNPSHSLLDARVSAAAAALKRNVNSIVNMNEATIDVKESYLEPDPDERESNDHMAQKLDVDQKMEEPDPDDTQNGVDFVRPETISQPDPDDCYEGHNSGQLKIIAEPDPDDCQETETMVEPDPDDSVKRDARAEPDPDDCQEIETMVEPDPDDSLRRDAMAEPDPDDHIENESMAEPDPDDHMECETMAEPDPDDHMESKTIAESDPDDCKQSKSMAEPDPDDSRESISVMEPDSDDCQESEAMAEPDPDDLREAEMLASGKGRVEPDSENSLKNTLRKTSVTEMHQQSIDPSPGRTVGTGNETIEWNLEDESGDLRRIEESTSATCVHLQEAIQKLKTQVSPAEFTSVVQILFTILRNVMDHPNEAKFKRLRKGNPVFQRSVLKYEAALEVLMAVGFSEDNIYNELGALESYLVLKRNDPGLLWLARSSLEVSCA